MQRKLGIFMALAAAMLVHVANAQTRLNVQQSVVNAINGDANSRAGVLGLMGVSDPAYRVQSVKITRLKSANMQFKLPPERLELITSTEILNCDSTGTSRNVTLSKTVENSTTVSKASTFTAGVEATVSGSTFFGGASVTASSSYSMTDEKSETKSQSQTISDSVTVAFNDKGGRISVLQAKKIQGNQIPWTATFVPDDNDNIEVTATASGGRACVYQHHSYGGKSRCFNAGEEVSWVGKEWNDMMTSIKIEGPVKATVYQHKNFGGNSTTFSANSANVGRDWNDKMSSIKVYNAARTASPRYADLKRSLPASVQAFTVSGAIDVSQTAVDGKRIINYVIPIDEVVAACTLPATSVAAGITTHSAGATAKAGTKLSAARPAAAVGILTRTLSPEELTKRLATAVPVGN